MLISLRKSPSQIRLGLEAKPIYGFSLYVRRLSIGCERVIGRCHLQALTYIAQVSSSVSGKLTDFLMRPLSHDFFCALALSAVKKVPKLGRNEPCSHAVATSRSCFLERRTDLSCRFFFDDVWFSSGRRLRAFLRRSKAINFFQNGIDHLIGDCDLSQLEDNCTGMTHNTGTDLDQLQLDGG